MGLDVAHSGAPCQALGHRPHHVAALEGRTRCREPLGPDEATEQALDLGSARRRPESRAEQEVADAAVGTIRLQTVLDATPVKWRARSRVMPTVTSSSERMLPSEAADQGRFLVDC